MPTSFGLGWGSLRHGVFHCITPSHRYVSVQKGKAHLATGLNVLALQGNQHKEVSSFKIGLEDDAWLLDLAGNAFATNIIAV